jgi:hypothetical protein
VVPLLCEVIREQVRLAFDYDGLPRVVEAYCHGFNASGVEVLRAVQVEGRSRSGMFGAGKIWFASKMRHLRATGDSYPADDPNYNADDGAIAHVHCRVQRPRRG